MSAPNKIEDVRRTLREHPEINSKDETQRGRIIDITARRLNGGGERPWGRKARRNDPGNPQLNTDGLTWLMDDGRFVIIDAISGVDGSATWDEYGPFAQGENGYWWPPGPGDGGSPDPPPPDPPPPSQPGTPSDVQKRIAEIEKRLVEMQADISGAALDAAEALELAKQIRDRKLRLVSAPELPESEAVSTNQVWGHAHRIKARIVG